MLKIENGILSHPKVRQKLFSSLGHGVLNHVNAIVVHQTDSADSESVFASYDHKGSNGAHFLIDRDGTIYQTLPITQKAWHVGNIRSRCLETHSCSPDEDKSIKALAKKDRGHYGKYVRDLSVLELKKPYPARYPGNTDSIGIEIVGKNIDKRTGDYETLTPQESIAVKWLIGELLESLSLKRDDVYRHPQVSYKAQGEAANATW